MLNQAKVSFHVAKKLFSFVKPHWIIASTIFISIVFASALDYITPLFYKKFFDTLSGSASANQIAVQILIDTVLVIFTIKIASWVFYRLATSLSDKFQPIVMADIERAGFSYLLGHSHKFFSDAFVGSLVRKVRRTSRSFETIADSICWSFIQIAVLVVVSIAVLYLRSPIIALVMGLWIFVYAVLNIALSLWMFKYDEQTSKKDSLVTATLSDSLTNNSNVRLFSGSLFENDLFKKVSEELKRMQTFTWQMHDLGHALQSMLMVLLECGILYASIRLWERNMFTIGDFVMVQAYVLSFFVHVWPLSRILRKIYEALADAKEMVDIFDTPHEIKDARSAKPLDVSKGAIDFEEIDFGYSATRKVLDNFSLAIKAKEKIALVGPSGAGKTTIVHLLLRIYDVDGGKILIDGQRIDKVTQDSLHEAVAFVPQDPILFHRTLLENIRYGKKDASFEEIVSASKKARCHDFIKDFPNGYETYVGERGIKLSGGERQRVAIARAILKNSPILVLDEATSSLDSESEMLIKDALDELMKNKTVIVIAHRLSTILKMDRIFVVDNGKIADAGTHKELMKKKGLYCKLWKIQAGGFLQ
ncbi:MAG: hypothetical protein ACD_76C00088G0002 [uncultured bacterium]|nr:MAG: hypothetical protein ACD_76C00088G0002 [uncultured bacterium]HBD05328.1 hypothetical protein [Candidatus Uhrbacteria bacterium]